jgi:hypothetical protein
MSVTLSAGLLTVRSGEGLLRHSKAGIQGQSQAGSQSQAGNRSASVTQRNVAIRGLHGILSFLNLGCAR